MKKNGNILDVSNIQSANKRNSIHLEFKDLTVKVGDKYILQNVSGEVKPGEMLAIMGPSGAGKSTLLNVLAGKPMNGVKTEGEVLINKEPATKRLRRRIGYVLQEDHFYSHLTVEQSLQFVGEIRLPDDYTAIQKREVVDKTIVDLGLNKCRNTAMGGGIFVTGCSGGEKKRCSIGSELITNPSLLILDEPTSGLDSTTAFNIIDLVKKIAKTENQAIITTIHQPPNHVFHMFDKLLLLSDGKVAYFGDTNSVMGFFESVGLSRYTNWNTADFIIDKLSTGEEIKETIFNKFKTYKSNQIDSTPYELDEVSVEVKNNKFNGNTVYTNIHTGRNDLQLDLPHGEMDVSNNKAIMKWPTSFRTQVKALCRRSFIQTRKELLDKMNFAETLMVSLLVGLIWFDTPYEETSLNDRLGVIYFTLGFVTLNSMFFAVLSFPAERVTIAKERAAGMYRLSSYYLAKNISQLPVLMIQPILMYTIVYWCSGLNRSPIYLIGVVIIIIISFLSQSIGLCIGAAFKNFKQSMTFTVVFGMGLLVTGGFYTTRLSFWIRWTKYISHLAYGFNILMKLELQYAVKDFKCATPSKFKLCSNRTFISGNNVVTSVSYMDLDIGQSVAILIMFIFIYRALFYVILRLFNKPE